MRSGIVEQNCAYAFLFNGNAEGVPIPALSFFTGEVLSALGQADPLGQTISQIRVGMPLLSDFAERTTGVRGSKGGTGRTISHSKDIYKYVIWEWLDSIGEGWQSIDREAGLEIFRIHTGECVTLSALDDKIRDAIDRRLKTVAGYVGAFEIDPGNPIHRYAFFDILIYAAAIQNGAVVQELSCEGTQDWQLKGSALFQPNGTVWQPLGWLESSGPNGLAPNTTSRRGNKTAAQLSVKLALNLEERVLRELSGTILNETAASTYEFKATSQPLDILQAIMPEGKFTKYLFDRQHKVGGSKAAFLIDTLGIDPEDWRYLAAQFYFGLIMAKPEAVTLNEWQTGYGAKFNVKMRIRNRAGNSAILVTGWNMIPGMLPSLSTAYPGVPDSEAIEPGDPPILLPGRKNEADWSKLWMLANDFGIRASKNLVPTPMFISGVGAIVEGECGTAFIRVKDARRGMARWLKQCKRGKSDDQSGIVVFSPISGQSIDRAIAWARGVACVLVLNGIAVEVESILD
ncbi:MAG: hypothetical protein O9253_02190 [Aquidulcibacter sp.]|jgi:hypothetical protein|nr:hypothetical protein [Aquidulcibacter sp.]